MTEASTQEDLFESGLERRSARERLTALLGENTIADLHRRSDARGAMAVLLCWLSISALLLLASLSLQLGWWGVPLLTGSLMLLAGRLLALAILCHEASHRSLFQNAKLNDVIGEWLCAAPVYLDLTKYRQHHARHHVHTGTNLDVDLPLVEGFPTTRSSLLRKFIRDVTGQTGVKALIGFAMMNAGMIRWNVSGAVEWLDDRPHSYPALIRNFLINSRRTLVFHGLFFLLSYQLGMVSLFLLWWASFLFTYPFCLRVRSIAEHAVTERTGDMLKNTRTTRAGWLARALFAPCHVNFHIEHHALVAVPFWQLPRLHKLLQAQNILPAPPGYWQVLKLASSANPT